METLNDGIYCNFVQVIRMLRLEGTKKVPPDYDEDFVKADYTFLYQLVFDPSKQILTSLNHVPEHLKEVDMSFAGQYPFVAALSVCVCVCVCVCAHARAHKCLLLHCYTAWC